MRLVDAIRTRASMRCAVTFSLAIALGCSEPAVWRYERELDEAPEPAAHAIHDARLVELMRSLERLHRERLPTTLDPRQEKSRQATEIARVAEAMAASAARIPAAAPPDLDAESSAELVALAAELQRLCEDLAQEASQLDAGATRARLAEIDATCRRCHARFDIPGLEKRRD